MTQPPVIGESGYEYVSSYEEIVAHTKRITIERCALVADAYTKGGEELGTSGIHIKIAAEIRKLKDAP